MSGLLLTLVNRSLAACWLILAIVLLRPFLRKVSPSITCALWGLVAIRLLCPFSFESVLSLIPSAEPIPTDVVLPQTQLPPQTFIGDGGGTVVDSAVSVPPPSTTISAGSAGSAMTPSLMQIAAVVWIAGIAALAIYLLISYSRLYLQAREAVKQEGGFWLCEGITSPFVLGVFRPRILLPYTVERGDIPYILAHERAHLARRDHWRKPIGFAVLAVFWFQPFLWLAYFLLCRDIEFACDERALRTLGADVQHKKCYAEALLRGVSPRASVIACPVAFGGLQIKGRVKSVLRYRKPAMLLTFAALIVCAAVAVCFLSNPITRASAEPENENVFSDPSLPAEPSDAEPSESIYPFYGEPVSDGVIMPYGGTIILAPHVDDPALLAKLNREALNADVLSDPMQTHLPLFLFDTLEDWNTFTEIYSALFYETDWFTDAAFEEHVLLVIYDADGVAPYGWGPVYICEEKLVQVLRGSGIRSDYAESRFYVVEFPRTELRNMFVGMDAVVGSSGNSAALLNPNPSIGWSGTREALVLSLLGKMEPEAESAGLLEIYGEVGAYTLCKLVSGGDEAIVENVYDGYRIFSGTIGYPSETHLYLVGDAEIYTLNAAYEKGLIGDMGALYALLPEGMQAGYDPSAKDSYGGWESGSNRYGFRDGVYHAA